MGPRQKFYGVAEGRVPGVYGTWDETRQQVDGFKGAVHKSFATRAEAREWVAARNPSVSFGEGRAPSGEDRAVGGGGGGGGRVGGDGGGGGDESGGGGDARDARDAAVTSSSPPPPPPRRRLSEGSYTLHFDGACRGNPGPAGAGALIRRDGDGAIVFELAEYLGDDKTNNEAEYMALVGGLTKAAELGIANLEVKGDSKLVVNQVNGTWQVKKENLMKLWRLVDDVKKNKDNFAGRLKVTYVPREQNAEADALANTAITIGSQRGIGVNVYADGRRVDGSGAGGGGRDGSDGGGRGGLGRGATRRMMSTSTHAPGASFRATSRMMEAAAGETLGLWSERGRESTAGAQMKRQFQEDACGTRNLFASATHRPPPSQRLRREADARVATDVIDLTGSDHDSSPRADDDGGHFGSAFASMTLSPIVGFKPGLSTQRAPSPWERAPTGASPPRGRRRRPFAQTTQLPIVCSHDPPQRSVSVHRTPFAKPLATRAQTAGGGGGRGLSPGRWLSVYRGVRWMARLLV